MIRLTTWQRLVSVIATIACLGRAWFLFDRDDPFGTAFVAGTIFAIVSLTPPQVGDAWLPDPRPFLRRFSRHLAIGAAAIGVSLGCLAYIQHRLALEKVAEDQRVRAQQQASERVRIAQIGSNYKSCMKTAAGNAAKIESEHGKGSDVPFRYVDELKCQEERDKARNEDPVQRMLDAMH